MKKVLMLVAVAGMFAFVACGPSAEEKAAMDKARQDSIKAVEDAKAAMEQARQDSINEAQKAQQEAAEQAEKAKQDSIEAAKNKKTSGTSKPKTTAPVMDKPKVGKTRGGQ